MIKHGAGRIFEQSDITTHNSFYNAQSRVEHNEAPKTGAVFEELRDFQRQESVYEEKKNIHSSRPINKKYKVILVIIAALIWWVLLLMSNPSDHGPELTLGSLLQACIIFSFVVLIIQRILRKQD